MSGRWEGWGGGEGEGGMFVAGYSYCFSHAALRLNIVKTAMQLSGICICILQTLDQKYQ